MMVHMHGIGTYLVCDVSLFISRPDAQTDWNIKYARLAITHIMIQDCQMPIM